jgi:hypothetical protein
MSSAVGTHFPSSARTGPGSPTDVRTNRYAMEAMYQGSRHRRAASPNTLATDGFIMDWVPAEGAEFRIPRAGRSGGSPARDRSFP